MRYCAVLLLLSPVLAAAQTAQRPALAVGDTWRFAVSYTAASSTPNRTWIITSVENDRLIGTENGEPLTLTTELNVIDSPRQAETNPRLLSFPLAVGKRWQYTSDWLFKPKSSRGSISATVTVVGHEPVEVPAGRFDAFKIESIAELGGSSPSNTFYAGQITTTYWYAPAARAIVKSVHHNPYQGTTTVQLVDFERRR
jgi:hypothetical protein